MNKMEWLTRYPSELAFSLQNPQIRYLLSKDCCAIHHRFPETAAPDALVSLNDGEIAVYRLADLSRTAKEDSTDLCPVYQLQPGNLLAIPTGRILISCADGHSPEERADEIQKAGYVIAEHLAYAPQAAWVQSQSGKLADALHHIPQLTQITGLINVEPQMLRARAWKS